MNFIVSRDSLFKNLNALNGVISSGNTVPMLDNFLFQIEGDRLTLTASDIDTTMTAVIQLSHVEGEGSVAIPARLLMETLKLIPDVPVVFEVNEELTHVKFTAGQGEYDSPCFDGVDFPLLKPMEDPQTFHIDAQVLQRAISKTLFAAGNDELRPNMMGIFCELSEEHITFVATDAHKLSRYRNTGVKVDQFASFILPKKPMNHLRTVLTSVGGDVQVDYTTSPTSNFVSFAFENMILYSSLREGRFPAYESVIPKDNPIIYRVNRVDFLNSIRRVGIYSNQSTYQVRIGLSDELTTLSAENFDFSNKAEETIHGELTGEPMDIGFNSKFLREILENMDSTEVELHMSEPSRAALVLPSENEEDEDLLMLIMPVMIAQ